MLSTGSLKKAPIVAKPQQTGTPSLPSAIAPEASAPSGDVYQHVAGTVGAESLTHVKTPDLSGSSVTLLPQGASQEPPRDAQSSNSSALTKSASAVNELPYVFGPDHPLLINPDTVRFIESRKLSIDEAEAIYLYTRNQHYRGINGLFRNLPPKTCLSEVDSLMKAGAKDSATAKTASCIVSGMEKLPPSHTEPSYRPGLGRLVNLREDLALYQPGAVIEVATLFSTTASTTAMTKQTWWHNKGQVIVIHQKLNGNGRDISPLSAYPDEREICFLPNTKFRVLHRSEPVPVPPGFGESGAQCAPGANAYPTKIFISLEEI